MMIVMKEGATEEEIAHVVERVEEIGCSAHVSKGEILTVIGAIGDRGKVADLGLEGTPGVDHLTPISKPYKLASRETKQGADSVLEIGGRKVGGTNFALMAGPCTVENRDQMLDSADAVAAAGATMLRGGAYKPRTSPYSFQGLGREGLRLLSEAGKSGKAVLLKRGLSATIEELLMASEYILKEGNENVMLCERGIRTYETAYRFTLDLLAVPALKEQTHLPVIIDPSHAPGRRDWVESMSLAAAAAGADGIIIEVHNEPEKAICDAAQQVPTSEFQELTNKLETITSVVGKTISRG